MSQSEFDYLLTKEQKELRDIVRDFARNEVMPVCREAEKDATIPESLLKMSRELGLNLATVPAEYGGLGLNKFEYALLREELSYGDAGFSSRAFGFGFSPLQFAGTPEQIKFAAERMLGGGITCFALTEAAGSDAANMTTTATKVGDEYVLNGAKNFITNAEDADIIFTFAYTDKSLGAKGGVTAFMLPADTPGITIGKHEDKMGQRCVHVNPVYFDEVRIPEKFRLGEEGRGYRLAMDILGAGRPVAGASAVGVAQCALDHAITYAKERNVFGKPICKFQGISFMLADMDIKIQSARQMVWAACRSADAGHLNAKLASSAKCLAADTVMSVTSDAVQIFGGNGYSREYPVEKLMRDAKVFQIFEGTNQIQRMVVGSALTR